MHRDNKNNVNPYERSYNEERRSRLSGIEMPSTGDFNASDNSFFLNPRQLNLAINAPVYYRECPAGAITYDNEWTYLTCSIFSTVIFIPVCFIWLPALLSSILSRKRFKSGDYFEGKKYSNYSLGLNIFCAIVGVSIYGVAVYFILTLTKVV